MKCNHCGTDYEGKFCPNCGTKNETEGNTQESVDTNTQPITQSNNVVSTKRTMSKKPFYKKWWFLVLVAIVVVAVVSGIVGDNKGKGESINWDDIVMGDVIPQPKSETARIYSNSDEALSIYIYKTSSSDYAEYIKECENKGFVVDEEKNSDSFEAYNADGYKLSVNFKNYDDTYMDIDLDAPIIMTTIQWPSSTVGKLLPTPKSLNGRFSYEHDGSFYVYIGNTSTADYAEYIAACADSGFTVDYSKGDNYYYANNSYGYHISLKYEGNNIMSVSISSPDELEDTSSTEIPESTSKPDNSSETTIQVSDNPSETATETSDNSSPTVIGQEFKEAMDSYESFIDDYVEFMKKYASSDGTDFSILTDYANYLSNYADMANKFEKWEDEDLNDAEMAYYIEVQARVSNKLLDVASVID